MYPDDSLTLHTDLYQINMMQVYFDQGIHNKHAVFEVYFRQQPFKNGYAVFAGLERIVKYLENLSFSESDIAYLESLGGNSPLKYSQLSNLDSHKGCTHSFGH